LKSFDRSQRRKVGFVEEGNDVLYKENM